MKNSVYSTKQTLEIKDIDSEQRKVAIYLSKFDVIDSDGDLIKRGAFAKSIQEHGVSSPSNRKIQFLRHHNWEMQIGKFTELSEDDFGLFAVAQLGHSSIGNDAWNDYVDGIIREHSIGFQYMPDKTRWIDDPSLPAGGYYMINEVKLWEGSAVTFGANEYTYVVEVMKGQEKIDAVQKISKEIDTLVKALINGKGTDERFYEIEMRIKFLNAQLSSLVTTEPIQKDHSVQDQPIQQKEHNDFDWSAVLANINV